MFHALGHAPCSVMYDDAWGHESTSSLAHGQACQIFPLPAFAPIASAMIALAGRAHPDCKLQHQLQLRLSLESWLKGYISRVVYIS